MCPTEEKEVRSMYMKVRDRIYKLHILIGCVVFCKLQGKLQKITTINRYHILEIKINYFITNNVIRNIFNVYCKKITFSLKKK